MTLAQSFYNIKSVRVKRGDRLLFQLSTLYIVTHSLGGCSSRASVTEVEKRQGTESSLRLQSNVLGVISAAPWS